MKPPKFDYLTPETIEEAVKMRGAEEGSMILAGGQSLLPTLNFRIANPSTLIDISRISALRGVQVSEKKIVINAMVRQREVELDQNLYSLNPLLRQVLSNVAHVVIRNRGTIAGSIAHADAAAELPAMLLAAGGVVEVYGSSGKREILAEDLFKFHMTTSLKPDEIITAVVIPIMPKYTGWSFQEFARRHGDYALAGVCSLVTVNAEHACSGIRLAACGISSTALRLSDAESVLLGSKLSDADLNQAATVASNAVTVSDEPQASSAYRRHLVKTLTKRTLLQAKSRAFERRKI